MGHTPEQLSAAEYRNIRDMLEIARDKSLESAREIMDWTISSVKRGLSSDALLLSILWHYVNYDAQDRISTAEVDGVLAGHQAKDPVHWITEDERKTLEQTLTAIRADFWFADWLALQVDAMATANHPEDRYPSPLKIAASLVLCIGEYEEKMEAAREMVRMHPNLLAPGPQPTTSELPPAPATTTAATAKPTKALSMRKPRKKVKRAA